MYILLENSWVPLGTWTQQDLVKLRFSNANLQSFTVRTLEVLYGPQSPPVDEAVPAVSAGLEEGGERKPYSNHELYALEAAWFREKFEMSGEEIARLIASVRAKSDSHQEAARIIDRINDEGMNSELSYLLATGRAHADHPAGFRDWLKGLPESALVGPVARVLQTAIDEARKASQGAHLRTSTLTLQELMKKSGFEPDDVQRQQQLQSLIPKYLPTGGRLIEGSEPIGISATDTLIKMPAVRPELAEGPAAGLEEEGKGRAKGQAMNAATAKTMAQARLAPFVGGLKAVSKEKPILVLIDQELLGRGEAVSQSLLSAGQFLNGLGGFPRVAVAVDDARERERFSKTDYRFVRLKAGFPPDGTAVDKDIVYVKRGFEMVGIPEKFVRLMVAEALSLWSRGQQKPILKGHLVLNVEPYFGQMKDLEEQTIEDILVGQFG
jgi:methylphosphotriester-DNA--protein-cysteine methyltransferase